VTRGRPVERPSRDDLTCGAICSTCSPRRLLDDVNAAAQTKESRYSPLSRHAGKTCTHQMILSAVWGSATVPKRSTSRLRTPLRQKLKRRVGELITTVRRRLFPQLAN